MEDLETISFGSVDDVFVVIHSAPAINENDWDRYLSTAHMEREIPLMLLVPGEALPGVGQRHDIHALYEKHGMKIGVLSDNPAAVGMVTALKWFGISAAGYRIDDLDGVLRFLDRTNLRARISSALGPYLDRSWLLDPSLIPHVPAGHRSQPMQPDTVV